MPVFGPIPQSKCEVVLQYAHRVGKFGYRTGLLVGIILGGVIIEDGVL